MFTSVKGTIFDIEGDLTKRDSNNILLNQGIDFNLLISSLPKEQLHEKCFTNEVKELINALSFTYNLNTLDMQGVVRNSLNEKGLIDKTILRKSCRDYYQFDNNGSLPTLIYNNIIRISFCNISIHFYKISCYGCKNFIEITSYFFVIF